MRQKPLNEIVQNIINNIHDTLPQVDTKQGTFIRDVFINPVSDEFAAVYADMKMLELAQSILTATDTDLDKLAANYFVFRKQSTYSYGKLRFYIKNTNKTILIPEELPDEILIPDGTIVSTLGSLTKDPIQVATTERAYITKDQIISSYIPVDASTGYKYIEVPAKSIAAGSFANVGAGELIQQINNITQDIIFVSNPFLFTGGTDGEDDASLALRVNLALSGSNIGTKDGYLSYILKQNGVTDAKIIAAGESIMFRDGGHIGPDGKYVLGKGGMVDIYIKGQLNEEDLWEKLIDDAYVAPPTPYKDLVLPKQPVNNISSISIIGENGVKTFKNAADYEIEKGTIIDGEGNTVTSIRYYKDTEWDFSITDNFPDINDYPLPSELNEVEIQILKQQVDAELKNALQYMTNLNYSLNWSLMNNETGPTTTLFRKIVYTDTRTYKIVAIDARLNGRTFVKKNDKIYIRAYKQPDYMLKKDMSPNGYSVNAKDSINWINGGDKPLVGDKLIINYNFDQLIRDLQDGIELKRVLTADVLVKQAEKIGIEVMIEASCSPNSIPSNVKTAIINRVTTFIDNIKKMGGSFDRSDIAAIVKQTDGVESVNLGSDNLKISIIGYDPKEEIVIQDNQYFKLENMVVNVYTSNRIKN